MEAVVSAPRLLTGALPFQRFTKSPSSFLSLRTSLRSSISDGSVSRPSFRTAAISSMQEIPMDVRDRRSISSRPQPPDLASYLYSNRIVYLATPIVPSVMELIVAQLLYLQAEDAGKPISLYINSTGTIKNGQKLGNELEALGVYDVMRYIEAPISTLCIGKAWGEAAIILAAVDRGSRYALPSSSIMIREMDSVELTQESQDGVGRKNSSNFRWTAVMTSFLLKCLVEQANLGLKSDKGFKSTAINAATRVVSAKFNLVVSDTQVNNRLRHVRKIWLIIKKLKSLSGVSWDDSEKKIIMGAEEFSTYIQSHPNEEVYINKPIEDYEEMAIVCGNDQATGSFARTGCQSSRSMGARMDIDDQQQDIDDVEDFAQTQPPTVDIPTSSTTKSKEVKKGAKRIRVEELEVMRKVSYGLDKIGNALEADKTINWGKKLYDEVMTLTEHYNKFDLGLAYDHLHAQHNLASAFINKDHDLRCIWMDGFIRQLRGDGGI